MNKNNGLHYLNAFLALLIVLVGLILFYTTRPYLSVRSQSISIAKDAGELSDIDQFYWFNRKETYFSVVGSTKEGEGRIVILPKNGDEAVILKSSDGKTQEDVVNTVSSIEEVKKITDIAIGLYDDIPVWEVTTASQQNELRYYLIDFYTGDIINKL